MTQTTVQDGFKAEVDTHLPRSITILGKAMTGRDCLFDTEEIWGVNNVAEQPEYNGVVTSLIIKSGGTYVNPVVTFEGDGQGARAEVDVKDGIIAGIRLLSGGNGYTQPPKVTISGGSGAVVEAVTSPKRKFHKLFAFDILPKEYTDGMKRFAPVMSWQEYADIKFPVEDLIKTFSTKYFTNTISYMIAYCAYLQIPLVKIYGVDVSFGAPYAQENRGVEYWIGRAEERGCEIYVPEKSHLKRSVSGAMYGERDHCNMMLFLHERINLLNILPKSGNYSDALKAQNAWWVLFPKDDEAKAHNLQVNRDPAGNLSFNTPAEFLSDIHMPPETWEYLRNRLKEMEKKGDLPFGVISAYEKLVLAEPDGGN